MPLDRDDLDHFYDLVNESKSELDMVKLINQIIHSFLFKRYLDDDMGTSVAIASDRATESRPACIR